MKKSIFISSLIALLFVLGVLLFYLVREASGLRDILFYLKEEEQVLATKIQNPASSGNTIEDIQRLINNSLSRVPPYSVRITLCCLSICFIVGCISYHIYLLYTLNNQKAQQTKFFRENVARIMRDNGEKLSDKQKRLEKLQAEMDELKKDE